MKKGLFRRYSQIAAVGFAFTVMALSDASFAAEKNAEKNTEEKKPAAESVSVTGFGSQLGSDHFLSVGLVGGYGGYFIIAPGVTLGGNVGVTFLNHIEVAFNYRYHAASVGTQSIGSFNLIYGDLLYRSATGSGFYIGPSFGYFGFMPSAAVPAGYATLVSGVGFGGKIGYDIALTRFLSLGLEANYFGGFFDGTMSGKFWF